MTQSSMPDLTGPIVLDDVVAAVYAGAALWLIAPWLP